MINYINRCTKPNQARPGVSLSPPSPVKRGVLATTEFCEKYVCFMFLAFPGGPTV